MPKSFERQSAAAGPDAVEDTSLMDVAIVLAHRWRLLIVLPLAAGLVTLGVAFLMKPVYTASTQVLPPQQQSGAAAALLGSLGGAVGALTGNLAGMKSPVDQYIGFLKSQTIADALIKRFRLRELYEVDYQFQARDRLAANSSISTGKDGMIDIEVDDTSPERAAQMATAYVEELQKLTDTLAVSEAAQRRLFFEKQLASAKNGLIKAETELRQGGVSPNVLKTSPDATVGQMAQVQAAVVAQEVKVSVIRGSMTESSPELQQAMLELQSLRAQLKKAEEATPEAAREGGSQYVARYREFKYQETLFEIYARQYEMARADEAREGSLVQVVDPALVPEYKTKPKRGLMAILATALTFILCAAWLLLMNGLRNYQRQPVGAGKLAALRQALRGGRAA